MRIQSNVKVLLDKKSAEETRTISIKEVARTIDYRFESVRQIYNDETKQFPNELVAKLCAYFNVGVGEILTFVPDDAEKTAE